MGKDERNKRKERVDHPQTRDLSRPSSTLEERPWSIIKLTT